MKKPVYMDYHATTPIDERVLEEMRPFFCEQFGNPASQTHDQGRTAREAIEKARRQVAELVGAEANEIFFTSGATESNNWCLKSLVESFSKTKNHLIVSQIEHSCVLDTAKYLQTRGVDVDYLSVNQCGSVDIEELKEKITDRTFLVSVMAVNNEIGTVNDYQEIGEVCFERNVFFHTDATQAVAYLDMDVKEDNISYLSMSSHKIYGPKGVGALFINREAERLIPLIHGGGHEMGLRSGTVNVPAVVGFGKAAELIRIEREKEANKIKNLRDRLWKGLSEAIPDLKLNGHKTCRSVNNLNVSFPKIQAVDLIQALKNEMMVSSGSACASSKAAPSHVLKAIGVAESDCFSNIRFSVGRPTTEEEIDFVIEKVIQEFKRLCA